MSNDTHERARRLITMSRVEGIPAGDEQWLNDHLSSCDACANEAHALATAIQTFRSRSLTASPNVVLKTTLAVRHRAQELQARRERMIPIAIAATISAIWVILTTPYAWSAFAWLGAFLNLPNAVWEVGFLMWWFLPATVLAGVVGWQHTTKRQRHWREI